MSAIGTSQSAVGQMQLAVGPSVKFVQSPNPISQASQNPTMTFGNNVSFGNLLVLFFAWANTNGAVSSVTDNLGNVWQQKDFQQVAGTLRTTYCFATIVKFPGTCTVTVHTDSSRTYSSSLYEFSGASISLDGVPIHTSSGTVTTTPATGTLTTTNPGSIVLAQTKAGTISTNPAFPWVAESVTNHGTAYQIPGVVGSFSANWVVASSAYATSILAFLPAPVTPPAVMISNLPKSFHQLADPRILSVPGVVMISYRDSWKVTQPTQPAAITNNPNDPSYNWSFWDSAIAQATKLGLLASFHISPNGSANQPAWVKANYPQFIDVDGDSMAVPWNSQYQAAFIAFVQAMGARYGGYSNLYKFSACIASTGSDWVMPHKTANWQNSGAFNCPGFGAQVNVPTTVNSGMSAGQYCFIPGFGWFYAKQNATNVNTQLVNAGVSGNANSGTIPANTTIQVSDVANWQSPIYGYTTAQLVSAVEAVISAAHGAFPTAQFQLQVGASGALDIYPGGPAFAYNAATQISQWAWANIPRYAIDKDGFNPQIASPQAALAAQDSNQYYLLAQTLAGSSNTSGTTGVVPKGGAVNGQFDWPANDPTGQYTSQSTNGYLANGGVPYNNPLPVIQNTMAVFQTYGGQVLEMYEWDVLLFAPPVPPQPPEPVVAVDGWPGAFSSGGW
jgi:hypothetical protein